MDMKFLFWCLDTAENLKFPWNLISNIESSYFDNYLGVRVDLDRIPQSNICVKSSLNK